MIQFGIEVDIVIAILSSSIMSVTLYLLDEHFVSLDGYLWHILMLKYLEELPHIRFLS